MGWTLLNLIPTRVIIDTFTPEKSAVIHNPIGTKLKNIDSKNIINTKTFAILESYAISYENTQTMMPFYTRVEEIEDTIFNLSFFDFFSSSKNLSYNDYYKKVLGVK